MANFFTRCAGLLLAVLLCYQPVAADESPRITVTIDGISEDRRTLLRNGLSIVRQQNSERLSQRSVRRLHEKAQQELKEMLQVWGFYQPSIEASLTGQDNWQASYQIETGEAVRINVLNLQILGDAGDDKAFTDLVDDFPIKQGDVLNHQTYEKAKKALLSLGEERGYFDDKLERHHVKVDPDTRKAEINLTYQSGKRYQFAKPDYPDSVINTDLFGRLTPFDAGEPFLASKVLKLRNNLNDSGYFASVNTRTLREQRHDQQVPVEIDVKADNKHRYTAGIGYGTDTGARLGLGWENRYVNDRGHRLSVDSRLSQISNKISADYKMPFWSEDISIVGFNTEYKQEDTDTSESKAFTAGSYYQRERFGWDETGSMRLLNEQFDISDESTSSLLLIPGIAWSRTWADDTLYTRHGGNLSVSLSGASEALLSDTSFGQITVRGKYIKSLTANSRLITRATVGATEVADFDKLPASLRFFAGGDNSIRGFDYQELGPENDSGDVVGGRYLAVGSVEYEHMFVKNWGAAVFTDFGNAVNSWSDPFEYSVGIGVRWRSPVGLIRVDIAQGISDEDNPIGLHIVIGPDL